MLLVRRVGLNLNEINADKGHGHTMVLFLLTEGPGLGVHWNQPRLVNR